MSLDTVVHLPSRPSWDCAGCATPWPCAGARDAYAAEEDASRLTVAALMALYAGEAALDLAPAPPALVYMRFLAWVRAYFPGDGTTRP